MGGRREEPILDSLLGLQPLSKITTDRALLTELEEKLAALLASDQKTVVSVAVNGERVDVVVTSSTQEWRIVYGTVDSNHVDWLDVFERPPRFEGVAGGMVVIVNGPSGSGKSSLMFEIQSRSRHPWVIFDEPILGAVEEGYLIWRDSAPVLHRGFLDGIAAVARAGNYVAVSAAGHPQRIFDSAFEGIGVLRVGLFCDLDTLVARERGREGRWGGLAESSLHVHDGWSYDAQFNSAEVAAAEIANQVLLLTESC